MCESTAPDAANCGCNHDSTWPVCSKPGNTEQDLCDMAGNVSEWVSNPYHGNYTVKMVMPCARNWGICSMHIASCASSPTVPI
ncbi:MAG: SUMF1/EgtB/PvdO family nonheme iron enzyme [Deltaproteobacteria bacterium]|nr:SUMF1/EgtB/PvdO family nonheme iron enzyme [Deltaproteobacteria bacterium]